MGALVVSVFFLFFVDMAHGAKLYFRHGVVSAAKTLNLLAVAHTYRTQGKNVLLLKPAVDTRFGAELVQSRVKSMAAPADLVVHSATDVYASIDAIVKEKAAAAPSSSSSGGTSSSGGLGGSASSDAHAVHCVLVDECQFLEPAHVDQLRDVATALSIPVICYGLRTDFRTHLFPGSRRLLELSDVIEEIKTTCYYCNRKAVFNLKHVDGTPDFDGPTVQLGADERYYPTCSTCYREARKSVAHPVQT